MRRLFGLFVVALVPIGCSAPEVGGEHKDEGALFGSSQQALTVLPGRIEAEDYDAFFDTTDAHFGDCGSGPVDAQLTSDPEGGTCNIGWTSPGEWLECDISVATAGVYDSSLRVASQSSSNFHLELDGQDISGPLSAPAAGWQSFEDRVFSGTFVSAGMHTLRVTFDDGGMNLNYLDISSASVVVQGQTRIEAEAYHRFNDTSPANIGGACDTGDAVDKQLTSDPTGGVCNIGWTEPGEWLEYDLFATQGGTYDLTLRLATARTNNGFRVLVDGNDVSGSLTMLKRLAKLPGCLGANCAAGRFTHLASRFRRGSA